MKLKFLELVNKESLNYQKLLDNENKKSNGIYYTDIQLTVKIIEELLKGRELKNIWELKFLEPAVGIGNFVFAYLFYISENYTLNQKQILELYNNIYVCDNDLKSLEIYKILLFKSSEQLFDVKLTSSFKPNIGKSLIYNLNESEVVYKNMNLYFNNVKFDIVVTNPPYKSLRAEKNHYEDESLYLKDKFKYELIKKDANKRFKLAEKLNANIFKYFVEEILESYTHKKSLVALLIPRTILKDKSLFNLRKHIIESYKIEKIGDIEENSKFVFAKQSLCYLIIEKTFKTKNINITRYLNKEKKKYKIDVTEIKKRPYWEIILLDEEKSELLKILESLPKFKDFNFIKIFRGELDLTINKTEILKTKTDYLLLRGRNIDEFKIIHIENFEYISTDFINKSSKRKYIGKNRIGCQQISNMNKEKRLIFAEIPRNYILGNSCNFIVVEKNKYGITLEYLLGILNSSIYNWYFKLFSSNNHINKYELQEMPISTDKNLIDNISKLVKKIKQEFSSVYIENLNNELVNYFSCYKKEKIKNIPKMNKLEKEITLGINEKKEKMKNAEILNNHHYRLSELDLEIIKSVPSGGNWTNIPQKIMNKSQRLLGIQKKGGRTTLYGRLEYKKPSYTITTYFNRPGNGCNIHPTQNRVLTTREGARLQSFFDDYLFWGNQKDILNQIGNAVPPLIGFLFGKNLKEKLGIKKSIDLFSGAGGLSLGIKMSGIKPILANDIDFSAMITFKINNPEIEILCEDITKKSTKEKIVIKGIENNVELICGGPPCQGFSLAGFRKKEDSRNELFRDFVEIVKKIKPKAFIFENVTGLLSYEKGKTFIEIQNYFKENGYKLQAETLNFVEYGIPQRRKRVIIIGVREDIEINPKELFPKKYTEKEEEQITVYEAISDLENIENKKINTFYQKLLKKEITIQEYFDFLDKKLKPKQQLSLF